MTKKTKIGLKAAATVLLLAVLFWQMDLRKFLEVLSSVHPGLILLATVIQVGSFLLAVTRWRVILRNFAIAVDYSPLLKIAYIGHFFGLFLPSAIGGDFFRAYYLSKRQGRGMSTTLTTTFLERSSGLFALLLIGTFFAALHGMEVEGVPLLTVFVLLLGAYLLANVALFHPWMHRKLTDLLEKLHLQDVEEKMEMVYGGLRTLRQNGGAIAMTVLLSLTVQFLSVLIVWVAAQAMAIQAPFYVFLTFIPVINLTIMVPLTINGIGLREGAYYLLFSQIGMPVETAVTLSFMNFLILAMAALPGGMVYSLYKKEEFLATDYTD